MAMDAWSWREFLTQLGVDPGTGVAGFSGSVVQILRMKISRPGKILAQLVSGTLIAVFLGKAVSSATSAPVIAASFVIGYGGIQVLEYLLDFVRQRIVGEMRPPPNGGGPKDASA